MFACFELLKPDPSPRIAPNALSNSTLSSSVDNMAEKEAQKAKCDTLASLVQPGSPLPDTPGFAIPPWRLPSISSRNAQKINQILSKSLEIQSSIIPGDKDLSRFILSNACFIVTGLLKYYFKSLKFEDQVAQTYGVILWPEDIRQEYDGLPHVWLTLNGLPIDNTYVEIPNLGKVDYTLLQVNILGYL